ncbi:hypothetical protein ACTMTI_10700 [Nonomuraea sp. H19]|uniref:hypothetical protein n=1 Tax=Nonomuraea sp. H19 TaxID=3452206 RepID=UPI003F8C76E1
MEGDHRVWPPQSGARHRRTPPEDTEPAWGPPPASRDEEPGWGRSSPRKPHPLDLGPEDPDEVEDIEEPWNPRIRRTAGRNREPYRGLERRPEPEPEPDWESGHERGLEPEEDSQPPWRSLPPSARLYGSPVDPGTGRRVGGQLWRRSAVVLAALLAGAGLIAGAAAVMSRITAPPVETGRLSDSLAGVTATLPQGWRVGAVAPVTGFTSVVRDGSGGLVMARPVPGPVKNAGKAAAEAAELYSRLLLKGDRVRVVEDKQIPGGHTRALRAEYRDVVNRPAFLRVMLLTRGDRAVLLVGLLQPEETARRQALDAVMTSLR